MEESSIEDPPITWRTPPSHGERLHGDLHGGVLHVGRLLGGLLLQGGIVLQGLRCRAPTTAPGIGKTRRYGPDTEK